MKHISTYSKHLFPAIGLMLAGPSAMGHPGHTSESQGQEALASGVLLPQPGRALPDNQGPEPMEVIELPEPTVSITIKDGQRVIESNGLPDHETGAFPNPGNPNALRPQTHKVSLPLVPSIADEPTVARPEFGIAVNGVIFDAGTGEFWTEDQDPAFGGGSEWNYEALGGGVPLGLDQNNAHVQPTGKYHYHGIPTGLLEKLGGDEGTERMILIGWAYDGFPIYGPWGYSDAFDADSELHELTSSYQLKDGERPGLPDGPGGEYDGTFGLDYEYVEGSGDLDECNGRFGVTPEFPMGTYYYVVSDKFPQVPRLWRGEPAESARRGPPDDGQGRPDAQRGERPRARPEGGQRRRPGRGN
ncbi:MAG: YHYH protein [Phycisphaerales bacterium JB052]